MEGKIYSPFGRFAQQAKIYSPVSKFAECAKRVGLARNHLFLYYISVLRPVLE